MGGVELQNYLNEHDNDMQVKAVIQYVKDPYTRTFLHEEIKLKPPMPLRINREIDMKKASTRQDKDLMTLLQQVKLGNVDKEDLHKFSAKFDSDYQQLLVDILTKTIQFSITVLELREIYPDTNVFEVPESVDLDDDISYPVTVFPIKPEFH
jgi:hypothetical protein